METNLQKTWDALLILGWRKEWHIDLAASEYLRQTGMMLSASDILRKPQNGYPWKGSIRVWCHSHLPKVNNWLWNNKPEHDVKLLGKLTPSRYDTTKYTCNVDVEKAAAQADIRKAKKVIEAEVRRFSSRNSDTDWHTVGGSTRRHRAR